MDEQPAMRTDDRDIIEWAAQEFRRRGERMTGPRRAVLAALVAHPGHLSADGVMDAVAESEGVIPRSSVYRALEALTVIGAIQHLHLGHGATAYHLKGASGPHPHAQCRKCGAILDLPADLMDGITARLAQELHFQLDSTHVALSGTCAECVPVAD